MLELPEAKTIAAQLNGAVAGRRIQAASAAQTPHGFAFYHGEPAGYSTLLEGLEIRKAEAHGGWVELSLGDARISLHDGANLRYLASGEPEPKKHQLYLLLDDGAALCCTVQMYAGIHAFREGELDGNFYYRAAREKPDPLSATFDEAYFDGMLAGAKPALSAKAFLATEQRIPGLGNGTLQDILFHAGIHPKTKLQSLADPARDRLYHSVKDTLRSMTDGGGRDTEKDLFGTFGGYRCVLSKNTLAYPCPQCGGGLLKQNYLGGAVYFCPTCQPEIK